LFGNKYNEHTNITNDLKQEVSCGKKANTKVQQTSNTTPYITSVSSNTQRRLGEHIDKG